jgi:hypothetical protein
LGRTEFFDRDVALFSDKLSGKDFSFHFEKIPPKNVTRRDPLAPLEEQLALLKQSIREDHYRRLLLANEQDLSLYHWACERLA